MQLKRWTSIVLSILIIMVFTGCISKEKKVVQIKAEKTQAEKIETSEIEKKKYYIHNEVLEVFPELKKVKNHLFKQYADVLVSEEVKNERPPIDFGYNGNGSFFPSVRMTLDFKENVTKEQMIEAVDYAIKELKALFPKEEQLQLEASALIAYTKDGVMNDDLVYSNMGFVAKVAKNSEEIQWEAKQAPDYEWKSFEPNINDDSFSLSKLQTSLEKLGFEKRSVSQDDEGNSFPLGGNEKLFTAYQAFADSNQKVRGILCMVHREDNMTEETFADNIKSSFQKYIMVLYEGKEEERLEALSFIFENMDAVRKGEEKSIEIGQWELELYSSESEIWLQVLKK